MSLSSILILAAFLAATNAHAKSSVGLLFKGSSNLKGLEVDGTADLDKEKAWEGDLSYAHTDSDIGGQQSTTNLFSIGASNTVSDADDWEGALNIWNDTVNKIHYAGPSASWNHYWFKGKDASSGEDWGLTLDAELNFYGADVFVTSTGRPTRRGAVGVTTTVPATATTTQFHPSFTLEKPFLDEVLVPYVSAGHYFYSSDPAALESQTNRVGVHLSQGSLAAVDSMVGGFIRNSVSVGARWYFMDATNLKLEYGRDQLETDGSWASVYSARLTHTFGDHIRAAVGWYHSTQDAEPIDYGLINLVYLF